MTSGSASDAGRSALDRLVIVLYQPQDLVNVALVVRAMKNMEVSRLRLVSPLEFDARRIEGIAHDTAEIVERAVVTDRFEDAVAGAVRVVATTARRRASRQQWSEPAEAAPRLLETAGSGDVALVFGREDRGLPNRVLDRCQEAICIPTNPDHPSLNLAHAALLVLYEMRQAARGLGGLDARDLSGKVRDQAPAPTSEQWERFFRVWERAMDRIGMFRGTSHTSKMRSYRRVFHRARPDQRELRLFEASAWRVFHYASRTGARLREELSGDEDDGG